MLLVGTGTDVAPEPKVLFLLLSRETEASVAPASELNVGEETGGISLPSVGALLWQAGSETNMASDPEIG